MIQIWRLYEKVLELKQIYGFSTRGARKNDSSHVKDDRNFRKDPSGNKRTKFLRNTGRGKQTVKVLLYPTRKWNEASRKMEFFEIEELEASRYDTYVYTTH